MHASWHIKQRRQLDAIRLLKAREAARRKRDAELPDPLDPPRPRPGMDSVSRAILQADTEEALRRYRVHRARAAR
jgi:hypothetical protein